jgi:hypothetical protein
MKFNELEQRYFDGLVGILRSIEECKDTISNAQFALDFEVAADNIVAVNREKKIIETKTMEMDHLENNFYVHFFISMDYFHYDDKKEVLFDRTAQLLARSSLRSFNIPDVTIIEEKQEKEEGAERFLAFLVRLATVDTSITDLSELKADKMDIKKLMKEVVQPLYKESVNLKRFNPLAHGYKAEREKVKIELKLRMYEYMVVIILSSIREILNGQCYEFEVKNIRRAVLIELYNKIFKNAHDLINEEFLESKFLMEITDDNKLFFGQDELSAKIMQMNTKAKNVKATEDIDLSVAGEKALDTVSFVGADKKKTKK